MEIFPYRWRQAWNDWDLRSFILMSLTLQMILIFSGSHRNHVVSRWISFILWSAYLLADWVATFALGIFSNNHTGSDCASSSHSTLNEDRLAFWSPFLLLHLGGPDTITAFSLEDNELWMRHLMGLVFQVAVAFYVFVGSLPETRLTAPAAMMFLAEILKSGEKSWSLMSASMDSLRNSMVEPPDPGTNFAKSMKDYASVTAAGTRATIDVQKEPEWRPWKPNTSEDPISPVMMVTKAHQYFHTFKRLMVDLIILSLHDRNDSQSFFLKRSPIQASASHCCRAMASFHQIGPSQSRISSFVSATNSFLRPPNKPRWSHSMAQYNLISFCLKDHPSPCNRFLRFLTVKERHIFRDLKNKSISEEESKDSKRFSAFSGEWALEQQKHMKKFGWNVKVEFDQSILLWHTATDLCY
nr:PREDICTED: uncharacterized protein LOC103980628 [Musa acuminata subsp. malaccensis]